MPEGDRGSRNNRNEHYREAARRLLRMARAAPPERARRLADQARDLLRTVNRIDDRPAHRDSD